MLASHEPYPAVVVNRWRELVDANAAIDMFTHTATPGLLEPPVKVLRLSLHPDGMAPRIVNLPQWRAHLLARLQRQAQATGDPRLAALHDELAAYPGGESGRPPATDVVVPLRYRAGDTELSFLGPEKIFIYRTIAASRPPHPHHRQLVVARRGTTVRSA